MLLKILCALVLLFESTDGRIEGQLRITINCFDYESLPSSRIGFEATCYPFCYMKFHFYYTNGVRTLKKLEYQFYLALKLGICATDRPTYSENFPTRTKINFRTSGNRLDLRLRITQYRFDFEDEQVLVENLTFPLLPGINTIPNRTDIDDSLMTPLNTFSSSKQSFINMTANFLCTSNHYGPSCNIICKPNSRYSCLQNGTRQCRPGWRGYYCDLRNYCASSPCKLWAKCINMRSSFKCVCNGYEGPQCESGMDPCINNKCNKTGICINVDDRPTCECFSGWTGNLCQFRDPCNKLDICSSNGHCQVAIDESLTRARALCICLPGWKGESCEESSIPQINSSTIAIVILSVALASILIVSLVIFLRRYLNREYNVQRDRRMEMVHGNPTYLQREPGDDCSTYEECEDPEKVLSFDSNVYAIPGVVYSIGDETDDLGNVNSPPSVGSYFEDSSRQSQVSGNSFVSNRSGIIRYVRPTQ